MARKKTRIGGADGLPTVEELGDLGERALLATGNTDKLRNDPPHFALFALMINAQQVWEESQGVTTPTQVNLEQTLVPCYALMLSDWQPSALFPVTKEAMFADLMEHYGDHIPDAIRVLSEGPRHVE